MIRTLVGIAILAAFASCGANRKAVTVKLKDQTIEELLPYSDADRAIFAGRIEKVATVERGSRRERVIIDTRVIAGPPDIAGKTFQLARFSQGDPGLKTAKSYLFAAYKGEWAPAWTLVEALPVEDADAAPAVKAAQEQLSKHPKP